MQDSTAAVVKRRCQQAVALHQQGKLAEAERLYQQVLQQQPTHFDALHLLGVVALQSGQMERAVELISKAVRTNQKIAAPYNNLGMALQALKRREQAIASYDRAIALAPDYALAHNNRGNTLLELARNEEALQSYNKAIALKPDFFESYFNRGNALRNLNRNQEALASYDNLISLKPDHPQTHNYRGNVLACLGRPEEAIASFDKAIGLKPEYVEAYNNRGAAFSNVGAFEKAIESYDKAISLSPDYAEAYNNRGATLKQLGRFGEALASYSKAVALNPKLQFLLGNFLNLKCRTCDWSNLDTHINELTTKIAEGEQVSHPVLSFMVSTSPGLQRKTAEIYVLSRYPPNNSLPKIRKRPRASRIRIGYFSRYFCEHPVSILAAELFEKHDRSRFEVIAFSFTPNIMDWMRRRLESAFDRFIDVQNFSDAEIISLARQLEIDLAVDLMGFHESSRPNIFAMRAAPVQISYLGYAGTMGAEYIDYIIADKTVIPTVSRKHYSEKIVYLPYSCMPRDTKRVASDRVFERSDFGLPQEGVVFCGFNTSHKLNPRIFDQWARIIHRVAGSVLWLSETNSTATTNLRREAEIRGIAPERLVFAPRIQSFADHLARHRLADLFLDVLPYNAHTTASDALWAGLPVLTQMGETFVGRIAASQLNAIELPELITSTPDEYERLAIELALNRARLENLRQKLAYNRQTAPLFDTGHLTKYIEAGYAAIYERYQADLPADHVHVVA